MDEKHEEGKKDAIDLEIPSLFQPEKPIFGLKQAPIGEKAKHN